MGMTLHVAKVAESQGHIHTQRDLPQPVAKTNLIQPATTSMPAVTACWSTQSSPN